MEENDIKKAPHQGEPINKSYNDILANFGEKSNFPKIKIHPLKEILNNRKDKTKWLIESFFTTQGVGIIHSLPSIGKTWWALKFCECIATGHIFADKYQVKKGNCLYIAAEDFKGIGDRLRGIEQIIKTNSELTSKEVKAFKKNIDVLEVEWGRLALNKIERDRKTNQDIPINGLWLLNQIEETKKHYDFIVIDTLAKTLEDSINNDVVGQNYMNVVEWLSKALNCYFLIVAHESKSAEFRNTTMGTIKFTASADIELGTYYYCSNKQEDKNRLKAKLERNEHPKCIELFCTKPPKHGREPLHIVMNINQYWDNEDKAHKTTICRLEKHKTLQYTYSQHNNEFNEDNDVMELIPKEPPKQEQNPTDKVLEDVFGDDLID